MKNYSMVVAVVKEEHAELGEVRSRMYYYFENPMDATKFYQQLGSQPDVVYINICAVVDEA